MVVTDQEIERMWADLVTHRRLDLLRWGYLGHTWIETVLKRPVTYAERVDANTRLKDLLRVYQRLTAQ